MNTLGVITARSGSKGIKDKNIRELAGKPLIAYTIESALKCRHIDEVMVSTDSALYADMAREYGAVVPFMRSEKHSADNAKSIDVLLEVIDEYGKIGKHFDNIVMLQPTSPLRTYNNLDEAFKLFYEKEADSVVGVCECEHSPLWSNTLPEDMNMYGFIKSEDNLARQNLKKFYRLNGAMYISKVDVLKEIKSFYGKKSYAYVMEQKESVDIDTELDFEYAEILMRQKYVR